MTMTNHVTPFSIDQIGFHAVRFSSLGIFETHKDKMVDPYAATKIPKGSQVEGTQYAPQSDGMPETGHPMTCGVIRRTCRPACNSDWLPFRAPW